MIKQILTIATLITYVGVAYASDNDCESDATIKSNYQCLSRKERTLVEECARKHSIKIKDNFYIMYKPTGDNPVLQLSKLNFEQNYGHSARVIATLKRNSTNRFGELVFDNVTCIWSGNNYDMDKSGLDVFGDGNNRSQ
jgi:hypothetical protein